MIIAVDFDGVLSNYTEFTGPTSINDQPVPGAISWLKQLVNNDDFDVHIFSSRSRYEGGPEAIQKWLIENGFPAELLSKLSFPKKKIPYHLLIDDRAIQFTGEFPLIEDIKNYRPWNKDQDYHSYKSMDEIYDKENREGFRIAKDYIVEEIIEIEKEGRDESRLFCPFISTKCRGQENCVMYYGRDHCLIKDGFYALTMIANLLQGRASRLSNL